MDTAALRPTELLDAQRNLGRWWTTTVGTRYADFFLREGERRRNWDWGFAPGAAGQTLATQEAQQLAAATPYWVSEDMLALSWHAADTMPAQALQESHLVSPTGFCYFVAPLYRSEQTVTLRAIRWASGVGTGPEGRPVHGVRIACYMSVDDKTPTDSHQQTILDNAARFWQQSFVLVHAAFCPYGTDPQPGPLVAELDRNNPVAWNYWQFLATVWTLMQQRLAHSIVQRPYRHQRKRLREAGLDELAEAGVQVITLRRELPELADNEQVPEHRPVDWRSRWIVGGHWRDQPYKDGRRAIWIEPYVKGPEGLPLKFRNDVYKWTR